MHAGRVGLLRPLRTRRVGFRQYLSTRWIGRRLSRAMGGVGRRLRRSTRWRGFVSPPLPIRAVDAVVTRQDAIFVHPLGGGQTSCSAFALLRFSRQRLLLRRRRRSFLRRRRWAFLRRRRRAFLRRRPRAFLRRRLSFVFSPLAVALPKDADDDHHEHHQDYKVAEIDADARPRRLRRSASDEIWTSMARRLGRSGN